MQVLLLDKPDFKYKDYIQKLLNLDINDKDVHIIYDLRFCTPFLGLLISSFLNNKKFNVTHEIGSVGSESVSYAENYNFFHFAESSKNLDERNTNYSGSYTPIMKSIMTDYFLGNDNIAETISAKISTVLSCGNKDVEHVFFYIISELLRNIPEHSHQFDAWHCSQHWVHEDYIESEIALIDYGIGYKNSLEFKGNRILENDIEAMKSALQPGITSGITSPSHLRENESENYLNSGYGLYVVTELCKIFNGSFVIISNSAIATQKKISKLENNKSFPGTAIKVKVKVPNGLKKSEFQSMIGEIISRGENISKTVDGAVNTASKKSSGIKI